MWAKEVKVARFQWTVDKVVHFLTGWQFQKLTDVDVNIGQINGSYALHWIELNSAM